MLSKTEQIIWNSGPNPSQFSSADAAVMLPQGKDQMFPYLEEASVASSTLLDVMHASLAQLHQNGKVE